MNISVVFADTKAICQRAISNIEIKNEYLKEKYTKETVEELDKNNYSRKKYASRIKLLYRGMEEAKQILQRKISCFDSQSHTNVEYKGIVFLDPGHGGNDTGATVPPCLSDREQIIFAESDITFAIAKLLESALSKEGYAVILSRDIITDGPSLYARSALCRAVEPDLSVSIHLNSTQYAYPIYDMSDTAMPEINYTRVYVWSPNSSDLLLPFYLDTHNKIISSKSRNRSLDLAETTALSLQKYLGVDFYMPEDKLIALAELKKYRNELQNKNTVAYSKPEYPKPSESIIPAEVSALNRKIAQQYNFDLKKLDGVDGKDLHMVREMPQVPSILVEPLFISNPEEQRLLRNSDRINQIAKALEEAIIEYLEKNNHQE